VVLQVPLTSLKGDIMRKLNRLLMAAVVAASTLMMTATPQPAAAETTVVAEVAATLPDGFYALRNGDGEIVGFAEVRNGEIVAIYDVVKR